MSWGVRSARRVAVLLALAPGAAQAAEIRWSGAPECRRELEIVEQVETMTERRLGEVDVADFELVLAPARDGAFELTLVTVRRGGGVESRRTFASASCPNVTDAAAVAIALTIGEPAATPNAPSPAPVFPTSSAAPAEKPVDRGATRRSTPISWRLGAGGVVDTAVTPHPVFGGAVRFAVAHGRLRVELEGAAFATSSVVDERQRGGRFQLMYAAPLGCLTSSVGGASASLCAGYELGRITAQGRGVATPYERDTLWHALRGEVGVAVPLSPALWVTGRIGTAVALGRPRFVLDEPESVHRPALLSLRASAGLELAL